MSTVFRVQKNKGYTVMSNYHLFDEQLSAKATTYLSIMLTLPPTWDYTLAGLTTFKKGGLSSVRAAINELEEQGYLLRQRVRDEFGQLRGTEYIVYETPEMNPDYKKKKINKPKKKKSASKLENTQFSPSCDFPLTENPLSENRTQSITNQSVCHRAENEKSNIDRLTDRPHQKNFSEILDEINYRSRFMPESENDCSEPDAEAVKRCSVPYEFRDKKTMKRALMFLFSFNYYSEGMNEQDKKLFLQIITLIAEIIESSISKNIPEKVCSSDTYETQRDDFPDEEADYFFRHGKTEDDMTDMFLKPSVPFEEKVAWLDEFVENWRNSEQHFIFSSVRFEFEKRNSHV